MALTWRRLLLAILVPLAVLIALVLAANHYLQSEQPNIGLLEDELPSVTMAVVDYQRVLHNARATRAIRDQIEAQRQAVRDEIAEEEQRLHERDLALGDQRGKISSEEFAQARREFEAEVAQVQRLAQQRARALDRISTNALGEVREAIIAVLEDIAEEEDLNLVLPSDTVLLFSPQIDLTEEVLERLDARLPQLSIETPSP